MIKTIVVGTDGSEIAHRALQVALDFAGDLKIMPEIRVVAAVDYIEAGGLTRAPDGAPDLLAQEADNALESAAELALERGFSIVTDRIDGAPASVLLNVAHAAKADLIVVGTHGRKGVMRAILGSVCVRLLEQSDIPVLAVRDGEQTAERDETWRERVGIEPTSRG